MVLRRVVAAACLTGIAAISVRCTVDPPDDTSLPFIDIETDTTTPLTLRVEVYDPGANSACLQLRAIGAPFDDVPASRSQACVPLGSPSNSDSYDYPIVFSQGTTVSVVLFAQLFTQCNFDAGAPEGGVASPVTQCQGQPGPTAVWPQAPTSVAVGDEAGADGGVPEAGSDGETDASTEPDAHDATAPDVGAPDVVGGGDIDAADAMDASEGGT
jgi:hypothetical protein